MTTSAPPVRTQLRIMWIAFLVAVAVYTPLPWLIIGAGDDSAAASTEALRSGLHSGALGAAVASFLTRRWFANSLLAALGSAASRNASAGDDLWVRLRAGCLVTWAVSESVALIGLILALITRQPLDAVPPAIGAAVLLYLHRPAAWPIDAIERAAEGAAP